MRLSLSCMVFLLIRNKYFANNLISTGRNLFPIKSSSRRFIFSGSLLLAVFVETKIAHIEMVRGINPYRQAEPKNIVYKMDDF